VFGGGGRDLRRIEDDGRGSACGDIFRVSKRYMPNQGRRIMRLRVADGYFISHETCTFSLVERKVERPPGAASNDALSALSARHCSACAIRGDWQ
jgi:hypothetical protein